MFRYNNFTGDPDTIFTGWGIIVCVLQVELTIPDEITNQNLH